MLATKTATGARIGQDPDDARPTVLKDIELTGVSGPENTVMRGRMSVDHTAARAAAAVAAAAAAGAIAAGAQNTRQQQQQQQQQQLQQRAAQAHHYSSSEVEGSDAA
jgi:anti-sigma factor RsiW